MKVAHQLLTVRALAAALCLLTAVGASANNKPPEMGNRFDQPGANAIGYEIDFLGDVTDRIPVQSDDRPALNPFVWMKLHQGRSLNATTVTYDAAADLTRVVQSGDPLPAPVPVGYKPWHVDGAGTPTWHTGINMGWGWTKTPDLRIVSRHWIYEDRVQELDAVNIVWDGQLTRKVKSPLWLVTYIRSVDPATGLYRSGLWSVTPYDPLRPKSFTVSNDSEQPIRIDTIGYIPNVPVPNDPKCRKTPMCEANQAMLELLNADGFPPPGDRGSQFIEIKPPKSAIQPHEKFTFKLR